MKDMHSSAIDVVCRLRQAGFTAYLAGGCVRDMLLKRIPKDYDVATNATPTQTLEIFPHAHSVGAHFGVMIVKLNGHQFEIATFRTDGSYKDGRRPESVTFSSPEEDAQRRDFTINGVFYDPKEDRYVDFVNGRQDLENRILRAIGDPDLRFQEDYLRLMRAVRFAATLDFEIEPLTWQAICRDAPGLGKISIERIREEFNRMLVLPNRVKAFDLLVASGLLAQFLPEILALRGCEQPAQWHPEGDVFTHTRIMLNMLPADASLHLVLAVLLHDIGKPATAAVDDTGRIRFNAHDEVGAAMTGEILRRMRYPNETVEAVGEMVGRHMQFMNVQDMRMAKLKRFMVRPTFTEEMELHRVDCGSSNGFTANYEFLQAKLAEFAQAPLIPPPLLNGNQLIAMGYSPGPLLGKILHELQTLQLEGRLSSEPEARSWVKENF